VAERKEPALTLPECMVQALTAAVEKGAGAELTEATFGKFSAAGAGWYWNLTFRTDAGSHPNIGLNGQADPLPRRFKMIAAAYEEERARMMGHGK
jgi:hypothetical protein